MDRVDSLTRSRIMSRIRSSGTKPEILVREILERECLSELFTVNDRTLPGKPDFYFPERKRALFADGAFWHGHPGHFTFGKSGKFWDDKIRGNMKRDKRVNETLSSMGILVMRVWDFEIREREGEIVAFAKGK